MKIIIPKIKENYVNLIRTSGYVFQYKKSGKISFILPMAKSGFPRFHIYAELENSDLFINLHLDQKKQTYGEANRHHGEYEESEVVKQEAERLKNILK